MVGHHFAATASLDSLLNELDLRAQKKDGPTRTSRRRTLRHPFRRNCIVFFIPRGGSTVTTMPGRTRNLSRSGIALLIRRVFAVGETIEIHLSRAGQPPLFLLGNVSFCRYAGKGFYELGVRLCPAGSQPTLAAAEGETDPLRKRNDQGTGVATSASVSP